MELRNEFLVAVPLETTWRVLNDIERIAPCLPGAQLQEIAGDEYRGIVKIKVGPITAQYKGKATFAEQDEAAGRIVLKASGRDTGGGGNANATITATIVPDGTGTRVTVVTNLAVTGKLAQFGRGVLAEVSTNLLGQFADCLEHRVLAGAGAPPTPGHAPEPPAGAHLESSTPAEPEPPEPATPEPAAPEPATPEPATPEPPTPEPPAPEAATPATPEPPTPATPEPPTPAPEVRRVEGPEVPPVDLLEAAGGSLAKRVLLPLAALIALVVVIVTWRRHRR